MSTTAFRIFDVHQHVGALQGAEGPAESLSEDADYALRSEALDRFAITAALVMPSLQYPRPNGFADTQAINDGIARYRNRFRARFPVALGTVQPTDPVELSAPEIERMVLELHLDGIAWHHRWQSSVISDHRMHALLDVCAKHHLPAFIHAVADSAMEAPWLLPELCEAHGDVQFVLLDGFSGISRIRYLMQLAKTQPNVIFDTALALLIGRSFERFVAAFGSERLIFGTDMYFHPDPVIVYPHAIREIQDAPTFTAQDRRNIFWENAVRLFPRVSFSAG